MFIGLTVIDITVMWRWFPEVRLWNLPKIGLTQFQTKGLSLEEINGLFGDEVAVHFSDVQTVPSQEPISLEGTVADEKKEDI